MEGFSSAQKNLMKTFWWIDFYTFSFFYDAFSYKRRKNVKQSDVDNKSDIKFVTDLFMLRFILWVSL